MDILRQLLVFNACKIGPLVANADAVLAWSHKVFGERLTNAVIRRTFYKQVGRLAWKEQLGKRLAGFLQAGSAALHAAGLRGTALAAPHSSTTRRAPSPHARARPPATVLPV